VKNDLGITSTLPFWGIVAFCTGGVAGWEKFESLKRTPGVSVSFVCRDDSLPLVVVSEVVAFFLDLAGGALGSRGFRVLLGLAASVLVAELMSPAFGLGFLPGFLRVGFSEVDASKPE
jgi:hypothetical protein